MSLDQDQVRKIAALAKLQIDDEQLATYQSNLSNILELVDQLSAADTNGVDPMAHPLDATQRLRADEVTEINRRDAFQAIAPNSQDGLYLVPKVIE